jgi:LacI family transcriptional regulator
MSVTITQVAEHCGVSRATVSRVLSGKSAHRGATQRQVREVAEALGYRPNAAARSTSTGRFGCVGLVLSTDERRSGLPWNLLAGVQEGLEDQETNLMVFRLTPDDLASGAALPRLIREACCDGLLIDYTADIPRAIRESVRRHRLPVVWLNHKQQDHAVYPNDFAAGQRAVRELITRGHQRIAYFNYRAILPTAHYSELARFAGYRDAMRSAGLEPIPVFGQADSQAVNWSDFWQDQLQKPDRPTAIIGYSSKTLTHVVRAADRLELHIPEQLSLIGFDDTPIYLGGDAATVVVPAREVGRRAATLLAELIADGEAPAGAQAIDFAFVPGATIANAPVFPVSYP